MALVSQEAFAFTHFSINDPPEPGETPAPGRVPGQLQIVFQQSAQPDSLDDPIIVKTVNLPPEDAVAIGELLAQRGREHLQTPSGLSTAKTMAEATALAAQEDALRGRA